MRRPLIALALLAAFASCGRERADAPKRTFPSAPVVIISIDTLRADRLPGWGYNGVETPAIEALRADGVTFRNAYSHVPLTLPSHVAILTGRLPYESGVRDNVGYRFDAAKNDTIAAALRRAGYASGAAVSAYVLRGSTGLGALFDSYDDAVSGAMNVGVGSVARRGDATVAAAERWLSGRSGSQPFFFFLHLFEPHTPYDPPQEFRAKSGNPYDGEIAAADAYVGRFLDALKRAGVYDRAIIILLSDHGEGLGDHGESEHGVFLYREAIHVPLIVKLPQSERRGTAVDRAVQLIDVAPTIAALTGVSPSSPYRGTSLFGTPAQAQPIYSETLYPRLHFGWSGLRSIVTATHQYIEAPRQELFDLKNDPAQKKNIAADERRVLSELRRNLEQHPKTVDAPSQVDAETAGKLAALGYIGQVRDTTDDGNLPDPKDAIADLERLRKANILETEGKFAAAAASYREILRQNPRLSEGWQRLAALEERRGAYDAAVTAYRAAIDAAPALAPQIAASAGNALLRLRRYDEARAHAQLAVDVAPGAAHHLLGRIALAQRDFATAQREAQLSMQDTSWRGPGAVLLAVSLAEQGRTAEAIQLLDRIGNEYASIGPVRDLQATRGDLLARMDRFAEAESAFQSEIGAFPGNPEGYTRLAFLYIAAGEAQRAREVLERMIRVTPTRSAVMLAADVWRAVGDREEERRWRARSATLE